ncbi:MAG TPA: hypothetical protein GXZ48_00765 [Acholeplasmataceae bacterium]|nr:hypothetical protein [Acholeplasmataceae bacterium]
MKFLRLKFIIPSLIVVFVGVLLGLYFIGGLKVSYLETNNLEFDESQFINFHTVQYDEEGNRINVDFEFDNNKVVAKNAKYAMIFDEESTIVSIVELDPTQPNNIEAGEVIFTTAKKGATGHEASNLIITYHIVSTGRPAGKMNVFDNSINFENTLTGINERHYKVRYLEDAVQVLYEIGRFSANRDYFPEKFKAAVFEDETMEDFNGDRAAFKANLLTLDGRLRGNTTFSYDIIRDSATKTATLKYSGKGYTYSPAAAQYLEENGLAIVQKSPGGNFWELTILDPDLYTSYGTHLNSHNSPVYVNPFFSNQYWTQMQSYYRIMTPDQNHDFRYWLRGLRSSQEQESLYRMLYTNHQQIDITTKYPIFDEEGNPVMRGGFHAVDENGNFLYDEDDKPIQQLYSLEQVAKDNLIFGVESSTTLERFQVGIQFKLTDDGLEATIMGETLKDYEEGKNDPNYQHNFQLTSIDVLPELTKTTDTEAEGMMVIPDGSGAVIKFNNKKDLLNYSAYNKDIYGKEKAFVEKNASPAMMPIMFNMFGYIDNTQNKGVLAILEKGAAQSSIYADTARTGLERNVIYFNSRVRQKEDVEAGAGWNVSSFPKWTKKIYKNDLVYKYIFLEDDELNYVGLANRYREYLMTKYGLVEKDNTTENLVNLDFLGAFERYDMFLGIKYMKDDSLTTFKEAEEVVKELLTSGVNTISVSYHSWTKDEMEPKASRKFKVSPVLGKAQGLKELNEYLESQNIDFYPVVNVGSTKGYKYPFGNNKYTARGVGNAYARHYPFDLATLMPDKKMTPTYYLSPNYYKSLLENMLPSYKKLEVGGAYIPDLGNIRLGSYRKKNEIYAHTGTEYQLQALQIAANEIGKLKLSAPFDYALQYADLIVDVPLDTTQFGIIDYTIPFYQLVVSGLVDYTTDYINGVSDKSADWYFAKALETGSNIQFQLSYQDPNVLLDTDYTMYYKAYYKNWKDTIVNLNNRINEIGIHRGRLIDHEYIDANVSKVTYQIPGEENLVLVVNSSNKSYNYNGKVIEQYSYIKEGGE